MKLFFREKSLQQNIFDRLSALMLRTHELPDLSSVNKSVNIVDDTLAAELMLALVYLQEFWCLRCTIANRAFFLNFRHFLRRLVMLATALSSNQQVNSVLKLLLRLIIVLLFYLFAYIALVMYAVKIRNKFMVVNSINDVCQLFKLWILFKQSGNHHPFIPHLS